MTATTFALVEECFNRVYQQLREDSNENAPDSNTWYAPTREALAEAVGLGDSTADRILEGDPDAIIGPEGETIAWVYECGGFNLYRITEGAGENELVALFGRCMGYDL